MAETVDDITIRYEEEGQLLVEELDKRILTRGAWATLVFRYREFDRRKDQMGPVKFAIRRYQKRNGIYRMQSRFKISNEKQARLLVETLQGWLDGAQEP